MRHSNIAISVRLACVRHAANVHPEPGSNSPFVFDRVFCCLFALLFTQVWLPACFHLTILLLNCAPVVTQAVVLARLPTRRVAVNPRLLFPTNSVAILGIFPTTARQRQKQLGFYPNCCGVFLLTHCLQRDAYLNTSSLPCQHRFATNF